MQSARDLGGLGIVLTGLGVFPMAIALRSGAAWQIQVIATINTLVLVGPGVAYFLAGRLLRWPRLWVLPLTIKLAGAQIAMVLLMLVVAAIVSDWGVGELIFPAVLAVFLVPAVSAMLWELLQLKRVSHLLVVDGRAFEPVAVLPVESIPSTEPSTQDESQNITSDGKRGPGL